MSLQWSLIAGFLYVEVIIVLLLVLPIISPTRWQKIFKSQFLKSLSDRASIYFLILLAILVVILLDAIREMRKYSTVVAVERDHHHVDAGLQGSMKLFRAQRNFHISGFSLFLSLVIRRLVILISNQAALLARSEAVTRQAESATTTAKHLLLQQKISGEIVQNDSNEAHDKVTLEWKAQISELQIKNQELENQLAREKKDKEAIKSQAESLAKEYDRLNDEYSKCVQSTNDKKSD
ncbi:B-cell receptor-associated protein 31-like [Bombus affinis]|uniref:B-cell receptor-associated protein 31-like n=1 Tax=Bombus affinis TaxID=309941 RepID=UPI0021B70F54|nr:B-cell receptor-associated protein 31-like [Bombus affinis]XP_050592410.1 B-cell receptor-associated protein 31-like [Bombus affinis]XP_050592411.1 B-cell receptor-associated protein 31-like [Bombus affinis]XP_050592412.1 B-cell receptor-associated protein 31-like [Bombus affinis]